MLRLAAFALILSGCVSVPSGPSPTDAHGRTTTTVPSTTTTTVGLAEGLESYRSCLEGQGLVIGEIPLDALGRPRFAVAMSAVSLSDRAALEALDSCAGELVGGPLDLTADPVLAEMINQMLSEFSVCMRTHGVELFPDPVRDYNGVGSPFNVRRIDWTDPALLRAADVCSARISQPVP